MSVSGPLCPPPSSSLPKLRALHSLDHAELQAALRSLKSLYCPLRLPVGLTGDKVAPSAVLDSGYASEDEGSHPTHEDALMVLRADSFERDYAVRWLTRLIAQAEALPFQEEEISGIVDEAAFILASFSDYSGDDDEEPLCREFNFGVPAASGDAQPVMVRVKDAPLSGVDHTDVGLQSWGASIILSRHLCADPARFSMPDLPSGSSIIELGAGTGLVSLTIAHLLPRLTTATASITATDFHPAVLENLRANLAMNFPGPADRSGVTVQAAALDWEMPPASLQASAHMLFAADVIYAPKHAAWLRDCAARLLAPDGVFWLIATTRSNGKFAGIADTVGAAFRAQDGVWAGGERSLRILETERLRKERGIGRGDEDGYILYKIGWAST